MLDIENQPKKNFWPDPNLIHPLVHELTDFLHKECNFPYHPNDRILIAAKIQKFLTETPYRQK